MQKRSGFRSRGAKALRASLLCSAVFIAAPSVSQDLGEPLEGHPTRLVGLETANMNRAGSMEMYFGSRQTDPSLGNGTGNQVAYGGINYAYSDRLTFGFDASSYQDPTLAPINGVNTDFIFDLVSLWAKYGVYQSKNLSFAVQGSIEGYARLDSTVFNGRNEETVIGSIKAPLTYTFSPELQLHLTPSVSVFPNTVNGAQFYGVLPSIGAGFSYKPVERLAFYGSVEMPFGENGNTITNTAGYTNKAVWLAGARYNLTPKAALDVYATNSFGATPATSVLSHIPDANEVRWGLKLTYTPGQRIRASYRGDARPLTARQATLQEDGFTLGTADVLEPGSLTTSAWYGTDDHYGVKAAYSVDRDLQIEVGFTDYADNNSIAGNLVPSTEQRYFFGPKVRLMDQNNGDPLSLSGRVLVGRQVGDSTIASFGVFYADAIASYKVSESLTVTASPKFALFANNELSAFGVGANYEVFDGLQVIGEASAVSGDVTDPTWALGLRYSPTGLGLSVDVSASNAIGRQGVGTMLAQDEPTYSIGITKRFDGLGWR